MICNSRCKLSRVKCAIVDHKQLTISQFVDINEINCIRQQRFFFISVDDCRGKKDHNQPTTSSWKNKKKIVLRKRCFFAKVSDEEKIVCMNIQQLQKVHNKPFFLFSQLHHNKFKNAYSGGIVKHTLNKNFYRRSCMMSLTFFLVLYTFMVCACYDDDDMRKFWSGYLGSFKVYCWDCGC